MQAMRTSIAERSASVAVPTVSVRPSREGTIKLVAKLTSSVNATQATLRGTLSRRLKQDSSALVVPKNVRTLTETNRPAHIIAPIGEPPAVRFAIPMPATPPATATREIYVVSLQFGSMDEDP